MTESLFRIVLAIIMALAVALAPRSSSQHDANGIPVSVPSAIPGVQSGGSTGNRAAMTTWAPTTKPEERGRARATTTAGPVRSPRERSASAAPTPPARVAQSAERRPRKSQAPSSILGPSSTLSGSASWYCLPGRSACTTGYPASGMYAAAGPALRVGNWRGRLVTVSTQRASVQVRLVDECQCPNGRLLDLYASAFSGLGPLSAGLLDVTVTW